jgi:hypothetical protein
MRSLQAAKHQIPNTNYSSLHSGPEIAILSIPAFRIWKGFTRNSGNIFQIWKFFPDFARTRVRQAFSLTSLRYRVSPVDDRPKLSPPSFAGKRTGLPAAEADNGPIAVSLERPTY